MIKLLVLLLTITSCAQIDYSYFNLINNAMFKSNKISISDEYINNAPYSFATVSIGDRNAILVLASIDDDIFTWLGADSEVIKTYKGLIVKSIGFRPEISISNIDVDNIRDNFLSSNFSILYSIKSPSLNFSRMTFNEMIQKQEYECSNINYKKSISSIGFSHTDSFCYFNDTGLIKNTTQKLSPLEPEIKINFYYK